MHQFLKSLSIAIFILLCLFFFLFNLILLNLLLKFSELLLELLDLAKDLGRGRSLQVWERLDELFEWYCTDFSID